MQAIDRFSHRVENWSKTNEWNSFSVLQNLLNLKLSSKNADIEVEKPLETDPKTVVIILCVNVE